MIKQLLKAVGYFLFLIGSIIWIMYAILFFISMFNGYRLLLIIIPTVFILTGIMLVLKYDSEEYNGDL